MKPFAERFPVLAAILSGLGITSILENADGAQLSNADWAKFETEVTSGKGKFTQLETDLKKAQDDLKAAQDANTAIEAALKETFTAAKVEGKNGVDGIKAVTDTLKMWGDKAGAMSTSVETDKDKTEATSFDSLPHNKEADMMGFGGGKK